jgi:membrane protein DedA with SNARE-associated domain
MFEIASQSLFALLATYGYWAVFICIALESAGLPLPGETMLLAAAVYGGTTHRLSVVLVVVAAAGGAIVGDNLGYLLGRVGGARLLRRYGRYVRLDERRLKVGQYLFLRYGGPVVFCGRFVAVLRMWAAFLAGTNGMPWGRFLAYNAAGGAVWATLYGWGGYALGDSALRADGPLRFVAMGLAVVVTIVVPLVLHRYEGRLSVAAERALPEPLATDSRATRGHPSMPSHARPACATDRSPTGARSAA